MPEGVLVVMIYIWAETWRYRHLCFTHWKLVMSSMAIQINIIIPHIFCENIDEAKFNCAVKHILFGTLLCWLTNNIIWRSRNQIWTSLCVKIWGCEEDRIWSPYKMLTANLYQSCFIFSSAFQNKLHCLEFSL